MRSRYVGSSLRLSGANYYTIWSWELSDQLGSIILICDYYIIRTISIVSRFKSLPIFERKQRETWWEIRGNNGVKSEIRDTPLSLPRKNYHLLGPKPRNRLQWGSGRVSKRIVGKDTVKKDRSGRKHREEEWQNVHPGWIHRRWYLSPAFLRALLFPRSDFLELERERFVPTWIDCLAEDNYSFFESRVSGSRGNIRNPFT